MHAPFAPAPYSLLPAHKRFPFGDRCVYDLDHSEISRFRLQPVLAIYNAESGAGGIRRAGINKLVASRDG